MTKQFDHPNVEWLIGGEPREVQLEALRRSYYGYALRDHKDGPVNFRLLRPGFIPARGWGHLLEMRLGKTPTSLNEFALFHRDAGFKKLVVFSPNSYKEDWAEEAEKYGLPVPAFPYQQSKIKQAQEFVHRSRGAFALVVNYEALTYEKTRDFLGGFIDDRTLVVADESIKMKNPQGLFFKAAMAVAKNAGATRILTGLPMTQGPHDFYGQGRFIGMYPGLNFFAYRNRFCVIGGFKAKKVVGVKNEDQLNADINGSAFVAKRKDWGKQTDASYYTLRCSLTPEQHRLYGEIDRDFVTELESGQEISADQVVGKLMKMQQITSGFVYDADGRAHEVIDPVKVPKVKRLLEFIEEELVGKVVVPFHYAKSGDMLVQALAQFNPAVIRGAGAMRDDDRDVAAEKARFRDDPACRVMLLQMAAGKYGHDLSGPEGDRCSTMVFFENTYSLDDRVQIEARNTMAFQTWDNVYLDMVSSPVERRAIDALTRKESVVDAVLGAYRDNKTRIAV